MTSDGANLVAFSATTNKFPYVTTFSQWTKEFSPVLTICGGVHPTLEPESAIQAEGLDAICVGEGENAIIDLCDCLQSNKDITSIPNIWSKKDGEIYRNSPRPLINNLDSLPFPDRDIFDYASLYHESNGAASVMASRGCPYDCAYCCNRAIRSIYEGQRYVRFRSVPNVINELKQILTRYPFIRKFAFDDDILPLNKAWFEEFTAEYRKEVRVPFTCNVRPNLMTEDLARQLKEAGCDQANIGIESGNLYIREEVLNRHLSDEQIISTAGLLKNEGIKVYTYNMVGLPQESIKEILDTIKMNARVSPDMAQVSMFYPYHGTKLFEICKESRLLTNKDVRDYFEDTSLNFTPLRRRQIQFAALYFPFLLRTYQAFIKKPQKVQPMMVRVLDAILSWKITAFFVFLPLIQIARFITKHQTLLNFARALRKRLFIK